MTGAAHPWCADKAGLRLLARVTPKSALDAVEGVTATPEGPALKVRVRAVAENGEANAAVVSVVARWLGLAKTKIAVAQGHKSRVKTLAIGGAPAELEALVAARVAALR
jgi:uncharacterized protein YggU (UPF0235/DUF167 family)